MTQKSIAFTNVLLMQVINISDVAPLVVVSSLSTTRRGAPGSCGPPRGGVSSEYHREGGLRVRAVRITRIPKYSFSKFQILDFLTESEKMKNVMRLLSDRPINRGQKYETFFRND